VKKQNLDLCFHLGLLGFFVLMMWQSRSYPFESRFYPQIVAVASIALILVSLGRRLWEKRENKEAAKDVLGSRFFKISFVVALATFVGFIGGFIFSILGYYVGYALFQEDRSKIIRTLSIGVALSVLLYLSFDWLMKVPLLRGWLVDF
jgi:hypothetical protein